MTGAIYHDLTGFDHINSSAYEVGVAFHVTEDVTITGLAWYRYTTGSGIAPEIVRLWRVSDTSELGRLTSVPDDGTVAWQHGVLGTSIVISAGETYVVAGYFPGSGGQPSTTAPGTLTPSLTITLESSFRRYHAGSAGYPSSADAGSYIAMDVDGELGGGGGGGSSDPTGTHAEWFSSDSDTNTHHDDLPWRTDANVTDVKDLATGATGFDAIKAVADAIAAAVSGLPGTIAGAVTTITGQLTSMSGTMFDTGVATIGSISHDMQIVMSDALHTFTGLAGGAPGALSGRTAFPTELWTLVDETDHTGPFVYEQSADLYVLTVTDADGQTPTDVVGVQWYPRIGWWCPFNGTQGTQRRFWDLAENQLDDQGRRMPGVLVWTRPLVETHIQAWQLT